MIRLIYGADLGRYPRLRDTMFRDRADQFKTRLNWAVSVNERGEERDEYDRDDALYMIWETEAGQHGGSMRLMPSNVPCMFNEHFAFLNDGQIISDPDVWEVTRFCLSPDAPPRTAAGLMLAGGEVIHWMGLRHFLGVFDARMVRIYRVIGHPPIVLGSTGSGAERISAGLWGYDAPTQDKVAARAGVTVAQMRDWIDQSLGGVRIKRAV